MKTKQYEFTLAEIMTIREALTEYNQLLKNLNPTSLMGIKNKQNARILAEQFKDDVRTWKE